MSEKLQKNILFLTIALCGWFGIADRAYATAITWDGGGGDNNWSTGANWSGDVAPGSADDVTFDATSTKNATWDSAGPATINSLTVTSAYSGNFTIAKSSISVNVGWSWAGVGTFDAGTSSIQFFNSSGTRTLNPGSVNYYDVIFRSPTGGMIINLSSNMNITRNMSFNVTVGYTTSINGSRLKVGGDVTTVSSGFSGTTILEMNGVGNQSIVGTIILPGVNINKASGTLTLSGTIISANDWTWTAGTVDAGTSTISLSSGATRTITPGPVRYYNVILGSPTGGTTITMSGDMIITNNLTHSVACGYSVVLNSGTFYVAGNIDNISAGCNFSGTSQIEINGTGAQTLSGSGGGGYSNKIIVNKPSGTLTLSGSIAINGGWTHTKGLVDAGSSTLVLSSTQTFTPGSATYKNITLNGSGTTLTVSGTANIAGNLTASSSVAMLVNSGTLNVQGDISVTGTAGISSSSTGIIQIGGSGAQTLSASGGGSLDNVTINKPSGILTLSGTVNITGDWIWTAGSLDAGSSTLVLKTVSGSFTFGSEKYNNLQFAQTSGGTVTITGNATVQGAFSYNATTGSSQTYNGGTIQAHGNVTQSSSGAGTVIGTSVLHIVGNGDQTLSSPSGFTFRNITINKPSGTLFLSGTLPINGTWTYVAGKVSAGTSVLRFPPTGPIVFTPGVNVSYYDVDFQGASSAAITLGSNLIVTNTLSLTGASTFSVNTTASNYSVTTKDFTQNAVSSNFIANASIIKISGNYTRTSGTFTAGTSTVFLNGTNQTITGTTTFYNLYKLLPQNTTDTLTFTHTTTYTIASGGTARFIGTRGYPLSIQSSSAGTAFTITKTGSVVAEYVSLKDSTISTSTSAVASTNVSGNTNWVFTKEFVSTIRATGGDYTTLSSWESALGTVDLTAAATKVFSHSGITGTIADNSAVTGATSGATGTVVHATSTQILIKSIVGTLQSGEQIRVDVSNYVTSSDTGNGVIAVAECYNDWPNALNDSVTISGQTTDADNFIMVIAPDGQSHDGKLKDTASGYYRGFTLNPSAQDLPYASSESYTRTIGIAVDGAGGFNDDNFAVTAGITDNIFQKVLSASSPRYGINVYANGKVLNSIAYGSLGFGIVFDATATGALSYNNTVQGNDRGIFNWSSANNLVIKNTLASGNTTADFSSGSSTMTISYSASSDGTANNFSGTTGNQVNQTFTFADAANKDFHLSNYDVGARSFGVDLSADPLYPIIDDIDGGTRPGRNLKDTNDVSVDIGADEMNPTYVRQ